MDDSATTPSLTTNPYLHEVTSVLDAPDRDELAIYSMRRTLCARYAWAIPDEAALDAISRVGPIVEIGAGTGYWASLLAARGVDVVAYDIVVPGTAVSEFGHRMMWHPVESGDAVMAGSHPERSLLLCWPPYNSSFAYDCVRSYAGSTVVYVGEGMGGCTGDDAFHTLLDDDFEVVEVVDIPTWPMMHDRLSVHRRR